MCYEVRYNGKIERFTDAGDMAEFLQEHLPQTAHDLRRWYVNEWDPEDVIDFVSDCEWLTDDDRVRVDRISLTEDALKDMMDWYWNGIWDQDRWHLGVLRWNGEGPEPEHAEEEE